MRHTFIFLSSLVCTMLFLSVASTASAQSCKRDSDCPRNYICLTTPSGNGVCVVDNNRSCNSNGDCATGWTCINGTCSEGGSGQACNGNGDCGTGYVCCNNRCRESTCRNNFIEALESSDTIDYDASEKYNDDNNR